MGPKQVEAIDRVGPGFCDAGCIREAMPFCGRKQQTANPNAALEMWFFDRADVLNSQNETWMGHALLLRSYVSTPISVDDPPKDEAAVIETSGRA